MEINSNGKKYQVVYADPPWEMGKFGLGKDMRNPN